jgi:hypothetical protein
MSDIGKLAAALCQAQGEVGGVQKGSQNTHQRFSYTSIEEMVVATRGPLRRAGLVVLPTAHRVDGEVLVTEWLLAHSSGESMPLRYDMPIVPGKGRPMDKAASASASQALNYLLRDLLLLPRGEAEDIDGRDDTNYTHKSAARRSAESDALNDAGLMRDEFDRYCEAHGRARLAEMPDDEAAKACKWLRGEGGAVVSGWLQQAAR